MFTSVLTIYKQVRWTLEYWQNYAFSKHQYTESCTCTWQLNVKQYTLPIDKYVHK